MPSVEDVITGLRSILAKLEHLDLFPPWDAVKTVVDLVGQAVEIATQPPPPDPELVLTCAAAWKKIGERADNAHDDLVKLPGAAGTTVWEGADGNAFRGSVTALARRVDTVDGAAYDVQKALTKLATDVEKARSRHEKADDTLRENLSIDLGLALPWELVERLTGIVGGIIEAVRESIGAYSDAADAHAVARREIRTAMDAIELPDHLPEQGGISVVDAVNLWQDDRGPLNGNVLERYDVRFGELSAADRAAVTQALANAKNDTERAWILAAVAAGMSGPALGSYLGQLHTMKESDLAGLDPYAHHNGRFVQPDQTTCGSSTLVMSKMENDPAYAMWMMTGYDPLTGETDPRTPEERFAAESQVMHVRTNLPVDRGGDPQFPWPPQAGTQPWAVAAEMSEPGGSGVPGTTYEVDLVDPADRGGSFDRIVAASEGGHSVPIYIGNEQAPRHVVLVTASTGDTISIYDPSNGQSITVSRDDYAHGNVGVAGWSEPWAVVVPEH